MDISRQYNMAITSNMAISKEYNNQQYTEADLGLLQHPRWSAL